MKRYLKWLLLLVLVLGTVGTTSVIYAEENESEEELVMEVILPEYLSASDLQQRNSYNRAVESLIVSKLERYELTVNVQGYGLTTSNVASAIYGIIYSNPQLFYIQSGFSYRYYTSSGAITEITFKMVSDKSEIEAQRNEIAVNEALLKDLVNPEVMTDLEIVLTVHDYLAATVAYAYDDYLNNRLDESVYTMYGALGAQEAVCQGYALAFLYMMNQYGIPCGYATSDYENHGWNVVKIGNNWYHLDVTWDDPVYDNMGEAQHDYFLLSTNTMLQMEPGRSDYEVFTASGVNYVNATDTYFEDGWFWHNVSTSHFYHNDLWYYVSYSGYLNCYDPFTGNIETISGYLGNNVRVFGVGDSLYYSKSDGVYRLDMIEGNTYKVLSASGVTGVSAQDGMLIYAKGNGWSNETIYSTNVHLNHTWEPVSEWQTYTKYDCTQCDETKTIFHHDVSKMQVTLSASSYTYDGKAKEPSVTLVYDGYVVPEDYYSVSYQNNVSAGTASVTVTGKLKFKNSKTVDFTILPISINNANVKTRRTVYGFTGTPVEPDVTVTLNGKTLIEGTDYTVSYANQDRIGEAKIYVNGTGNYQGTVIETYAISSNGPVPSAVRISGATRYQTSLKIANELKSVLGVNQFDVVILANGRDFADALAGSYLAAKKNAPILMVDSKKNNMSEIRSYLDGNMNPNGTVYILGGEAAVPEWAETSLEGYNTVRLKGSNRYGTNLAILNEAGVGIEEILVCNAKSFADSLSASATGKPLLLVGGSLNAAQKEFLEEHRGSRFTIIGGTGAVSSEMESALSEYGSVMRLSGANRYVTSVAIAEHYYDDADRVVLAYARNYPDGLCGGPLAYALNAPLILVDTDKNPAHDDTAVMYAYYRDIIHGVVLGGKQLVKDLIVKDVLRTEDCYPIELR